MASATQTLGAGVRTLTGSNVQTYTLQHLTASSLHPLGSIETIIVPNIELGRAPECAIRFEADTPTVSRKHTSIERRKAPDGATEWVVRNLSGTNPTLINGKPVEKEWILQNGDVVQLSYEGPKLLFNVTSQKTSSIGLTGRIKLFGQQALRPYRTAVIILSVMVLLLLGVGIWLLIRSQNIADKSDLMAATIESMEEKNKLLAENNQTLLAEQQKTAENLSELNKQNQQLQNQLSGWISEGGSYDATPKATGPSDAIATNLEDLVAQATAHVYLIRVKKLQVEIDGKKQGVSYSWEGTGFMLNDGRFVTARHVIEPWYYFKDPKSSGDQMLVKLNAVANNGGKVVATLEAINPKGESFTFKSTDCKIDRKNDIPMVLKVDGEKVTIYQAGLKSPDCASYANKSSKGGLPFNNSLSTSLNAGRELHILGFTFGSEMQSGGTPAPFYGKVNVAQSGVQAGSINISGRSFDSGNSGGPVFALEGSKLVVVGVVSAKLEVLGMIAPIAYVK